MKEAGVAQIKSALSRYLSWVKRGEEVVVTQHGQPIAKLVPYRITGAHPKERAELVRQGVLAPGVRRPHASLLRLSPVKDPKGRLLQEIAAEREED